jgi:DNA-binding CsgD family transcriptional regulator
MDLIDAIYATTDGSLSPQVLLDHLAEFFEFSLSTEQEISTSGDSSELVAAASMHYRHNSESLREIVEGYNASFSELNTLPAIAFEKGIVRTGKILTTEDFMPLKGWRKHDYYNEFFRPQQWEDHIGIPVIITDSTILSYTFARDKQNPIHGETLDLLKRIVPHLVRSATMRHFTANARLNEKLGWETLNHSPHGALVLSNRKNIVFANEIAQNEVNTGTVVKLMGGKLRACEKRQSRRLDREIDKAIQGSALAEIESTGNFVTLRCESGHKILYAICHPLRSGSNSRSSEQAACLVLLINRSRNMRVSAQMLQNTFGLTVTEARVALAIASGLSLESCAQSMGHSVATSRTLLKRVFAKTDTRRQNELTHLIMALNSA